MTEVTCANCNEGAEIDLPEDAPPNVAWECTNCGAQNNHTVSHMVADAESAKGQSSNS